METTKPRLKCKTPIQYSADKRITDLKTPINLRVITPIKTPKLSKTPKLLRVILKDQILILRLILCKCFFFPNRESMLMII